MKPIQTLTSLEGERLLDEILRENGTCGQKLTGLRNYTIALLMLDAGLRVGEVCKLTVGDLLQENVPVTSLLVRAAIAKNITERIVPLTQRLQKAITKMFLNHWSGHNIYEHHYAFYAVWSETPLSRRQVERIIKRGAILGIGRPVHPHVLRHTFASKLMRTTNIRIVQQLLGHKSLTSTQIYTHPNQLDYQKAIRTMEAENSTGTSHNPTENSTG